MKFFSLARVSDIGDKWHIEAIITNSQKEFEGGQNYIGINNVAALVVKREIEKGNTVKVNKNFEGLEILPGHLIISTTTTTELDELKYSKLANIRQHVTHEQAVVNGLQMYDFIVINNELNSKGYFIYDDNREEVYLNILETGDEALIDKLEIYLNAKDVIHRASSLEHKYLKFYADIKDADTEEEVNKLYNTFSEYIVDHSV
jgi:hypothetical protein